MVSLRVEKVVFETSSEVLCHSFTQPSHDSFISSLVFTSSFREWRLEHVSQDRNSVVSQIALSVLRDGRLQFYVALGDPSWLERTIDHEAVIPHH